MYTASYKKILFILILIVTLSLLSLNLFAEELPDREYIIGPEDILEIHVWNNEDLHRTIEVSKEGAFTFPLIGKVNAIGLSVFALEKNLKEKLDDGYIVAPEVTVSVTKYRR